MRRIGSRIAVLLGIFILSCAVFFILAGTEGKVSETQEMSDATFPVLFFTCNGEEINQTFGYAQQMDLASIRDTVTPVPDDLTIPVKIETYENSITSISYNIYSPDGTQLLEEHSAVSVETADGEADAEVILFDALESGEEAVLEVVLTLDDDALLYYYTRLTMLDEVPVTLGISFVKTFHEETLSGSDGSSLTAYLETDSDTEYTTLDHVTIESSTELVMWGTLSPVIASAVSLDIAELNESYQAFTLTYLVSSALTGATYYVEEYFRIRIISSQPYLLDYDRTAEQIFAAVDAAVSGDAVQLGIRDADVYYLSNEESSVAAFVQTGELWSYNADTGTLTRVYGYLDTDESGSADTDFRDLNMEHDIYICSLDDSGNLYFMVYGYFSRGVHEGENGVALYYYDAIERTVEEKIFFTSDRTYQVLKEEIGTFSYVNADGAFCLMCMDTMYRISADDMEITTLCSGIDLDYCVISDSGRYAAFLYQGEGDSAQAVSVIDLDTGIISQVSGNGGYIRPLGYLGENLVCGIAQTDDIMADAAGNVTFAMNTLLILNTDLSVKKEYDEGSYYITEAVIEDGAIHLSRVTKADDGYEEASDDTIIDYDSLGDESAAVSAGIAEGTQEIQVLLSMTVSEEETELVIPEIIVAESQIQTTLLQTSSGGYAWRVYRSQEIIYAGDSLSEAVLLADETAGVVTDASGVLVWRRNNDSSGSVSSLQPQTQAEDSLRACLAAALAADGASDDSISEALARSSDAEEIVSAVLPDAVYLDLSGCTLDEVLYFTAQGRPVLTLLGETTYLIVSYSSSSVTLYQPLSDSESVYTMSALESALEDAGNIFCAWIP